MNKDLFEKVKELFEKWHAPGHDFNHAIRVSLYAKEIAKSENYNIEEAEVAGLLHDMGRTVPNDHNNHAKAGVPIAGKLLDEYTSFSSETRNRILNAIEHHSDKKTTGELANILQDSDKLDGMGAIGVFRTASAKYSLPDYDQNSLSLTTETASDNPKTLYEQLLYQIRWMDMLYTDKAKEIALPRYKFMVEFLEELNKEIEEST